jgi:pyruvate dehydrogenase E1 component alpha subunit
LRLLVLRLRDPLPLFELREREPLLAFERPTVAAGVMEPGNPRRTDAENTAEIDAAVAAAESAPMPSTDDVVTDVYVSAGGAR